MYRSCYVTTTVAALLVAGASAAQVPEPLVPVTDAMLQDPDPSDWLMWRRTLDTDRKSVV